MKRTFRLHDAAGAGGRDDAAGPGSGEAAWHDWGARLQTYLRSHLPDPQVGSPGRSLNPLTECCSSAAISHIRCVHTAASPALPGSLLAPLEKLDHFISACCRRYW